jgi:hypothetical protein
VTVGGDLRLRDLVRRDRGGAVHRLGPAQFTLPRQLFAGLRDQLDPSIVAVATFMMLISVLLLVTVELLRRRSERMRGLR